MQDIVKFYAYNNDLVTEHFLWMFTGAREKNNDKKSAHWVRIIHVIWNLIIIGTVENSRILFVFFFFRKYVRKRMK